MRYHNTCPVEMLMRQFLTNHCRNEHKKEREATDAVAGSLGPDVGNGGGSQDEDEEDEVIVSNIDD
jgi:hypothetical protein